MTRIAGAAVFVIGCSTSPMKSPTSPPMGSASEPLACAMQVAITGTGTTPVSTMVGPLALDANGTDVCIHLDATQLPAAHFVAASANTPGPATPVDARLEDTSFDPIIDGWDVTVGQTSPESHMNLEWDAPAKTSTDVVLWVRADSGTVSTEVSLSLLVPLPD